MCSASAPTMSGWETNRGRAKRKRRRRPDPGRTPPGSRRAERRAYRGGDHRSPASGRAQHAGGSIELRFHARVTCRGNSRRSNHHRSQLQPVRTRTEIDRRRGRRGMHHLVGLFRSIALQKPPFVSRWKSRYGATQPHVAANRLRSIRLLPRHQASPITDVTSSARRGEHHLNRRRAGLVDRDNIIVSSRPARAVNDRWTFDIFWEAKRRRRRTPICPRSTPHRSPVRCGQLVLPHQQRIRQLNWTGNHAFRSPGARPAHGGTSGIVIIAASQSPRVLIVPWRATRRYELESSCRRRLFLIEPTLCCR